MHGPINLRFTSRYIEENVCPAIGNTGLINPTDHLLVFWPVNLFVGWDSYGNVQLF